MQDSRAPSYAGPADDVRRVTEVVHSRCGLAVALDATAPLVWDVERAVVPHDAAHRAADLLTKWRVT